MPVLHMDTEAVRGVGSQLGQSAESLRQQSQQLRNVTGWLMGEWQGGSASMFESEMMTLLQRVGQSAEAGTMLHQKLEREVAEWLHAADVLGVGLFDDVIDSTDKTDEDSKSQGDVFDWLKFFSKTAPYSFKEGLLPMLKNIPYERYKDLGRFINIEMLGNSRGGWVGRMDDIGHFVKSPWVQTGVPLGLKVLLSDDFREGDIGRAVGGSIISEVITAGATRLIPGFGTVMLVSDGVQFGGTVLAGGLELFGYTDEAVWIQNNLDHIDLGRYVDDISGAVYDTVGDWVQDPSEFVTDVTQVAGFIEDVGAGMVDVGGSVMSTISGWF